MRKDTSFSDLYPLLARGPLTDPQRDGQGADLITLRAGLFRLGSAAGCDLVLADPAVAPVHTILKYQEGGCQLRDAGSSLGTFVNGHSIRLASLRRGDWIHVGPYVFRYRDGLLFWVRQSISPALAALGLTVKIGSRKLLDGVSLCFQPGDFVGLLGPSGAGKTTLLHALGGWFPAQEGRVFLGSYPLHGDNDPRLRKLMGYVPQQDIVHPELTCRQAWTYAAQLRLSPSLGTYGCRQRVLETLESLDLTQHADVRLSSLSGGQRKRANLGMELLVKPKVLFLDEPTSGLDPNAETRLMRLFRRLAGEGRIVLCTTHVVENVDCFNKVVILAAGGRIAYQGSPAQAREYFSADSFTEIYDRLEEKSPEHWQQRFQASSEHERLVNEAAGERLPKPFNRQGLPSPAPPMDFWPQTAILTRRFCRILTCDFKTLAVLVAQPLLFAALICMVFQAPATVRFLAVIAVSWFGCGAAAQQLVRERPVFLREYRAGLRIGPYLLSKFLPLAVLGLGQSLLLCSVISLCREEAMEAILLASTVLASWNGIGLGLLVSAWSANADKATAVVPFTILPQIILAGSLIPLADMNLPTRALAELTPAKWANQATAVGLLYGQPVGEELFATNDYVLPLRNLYLDYDVHSLEGRSQWLQDHAGLRVEEWPTMMFDFLALGAFVALQLGATAILIHRQQP